MPLSLNKISGEKLEEFIFVLYLDVDHTKIHDHKENDSISVNSILIVERGYEDLTEVDKKLDNLEKALIEDNVKDFNKHNICFWKRLDFNSENIVRDEVSANNLVDFDNESYQNIKIPWFFKMFSENSCEQKLWLEKNLLKFSFNFSAFFLNKSANKPLIIREDKGMCLSFSVKDIKISKPQKNNNGDILQLKLNVICANKLLNSTKEIPLSENPKIFNENNVSLSDLILENPSKKYKKNQSKCEVFFNKMSENAEYYQKAIKKSFSNQPNSQGSKKAGLQSPHDESQSSLSESENANGRAPESIQDSNNTGYFTCSFQGEQAHQREHLQSNQDIHDNQPLEGQVGESIYYSFDTNKYSKSNQVSPLENKLSANNQKLEDSDLDIQELLKHFEDYEQRSREDLYASENNSPDFASDFKNPNENFKFSNPSRSAFLESDISQTFHEPEGSELGVQKFSGTFKEDEQRSKEDLYASENNSLDFTSDFKKTNENYKRQHQSDYRVVKMQNKRKELKKAPLFSEWHSVSNTSKYRRGYKITEGVQKEQNKYIKNLNREIKRLVEVTAENEKLKEKIKSQEGKIADLEKTKRLRRIENDNLKEENEGLKNEIIKLKKDFEKDMKRLELEQKDEPTGGQGTKDGLEENKSCFETKKDLKDGVRNNGLWKPRILVLLVFVFIIFSILGSYFCLKQTEN